MRFCFQLLNSLNLDASNFNDTKVSLIFYYMSIIKALVCGNIENMYVCCLNEHAYVHTYYESKQVRLIDRS